MLLFSGCGAPSEPPPIVPPGVVDADPLTVGRVGRSQIQLVEVEKPIQFALFDLERQRYELLRQSLEIAVLERIDASGGALRSAELRLTPPLPPRVRIEPDPQRLRPTGDAPVTLLAFCNFESTHCARLHQQLARTLPLFEDTVRFASRDFSLPFHQHADRAAEAARCALEQGRYWQFHEVVFAGSGQLDDDRIARLARAAQLDLTRFQSCLQTGRYRDAVVADAELARSLGIERVPAVFVNGLYAGSNPQMGQLVWLIEHELERLGRPSPRSTDATRTSTEPLTVKAVLHSSQPGQGLVMLAPTGAPERAAGFRVGDAVGSSATVRRITESRVELLKGGISEWLGLDSEPRMGSAVSQPQEPQASEDEMDPARIWPHRGVPVTLDRTEVLVRLTDRAALEQALVQVPMTAGGYHLLRIAEIEEGSLYELLGLEQGDVILLVNEKPLHEGDNPLWNALQSEDEVRLRVMRRGGLAHHFTFRFEN
jgi:protein-disulfide isomerase/type II secretory pathway component PulC